MYIKQKFDAKMLIFFASMSIPCFLFLDYTTSFRWPLFSNNSLLVSLCVDSIGCTTIG